MSESAHLRAAREILRKAQGKSLSLEEREQLAVDLAAYMLAEANSTMTSAEKSQQVELSRMMLDPIGKIFTINMTDQCFRSRKSSRIANQLVYLLNTLGIPRYLNWGKRFSLGMFQLFGKAFSWLFVPLATWTLRRATAKVILPGEKNALKRHILKRRREGVRLNLNHLGEAILGEKEAQKRLKVYLNDLKQEDIEYVSIKITTIYSQIHLLGWEHTLSILSERLRQLYRAAMKHSFVRVDGSRIPKFVNLDMEEHRDLLLTKELFQQVLDEPEFFHHSAGIVLQAYLPDSYEIQKELTSWAMQRVQKGGAPIKIRIVKGANLAMEQFEASLKGWPQTPYQKKSEVDANYKKMVTYGSLPPHAHAVHLGIASHNLFDIAYAMLLRAEYKVEKEVIFEMLEGMADHIRRVVQQITGAILLYCPVATKEDFQSAIAYLIRRLDENTGPENFLRHIFGLRANSAEWGEQVLLFAKACREMHTVYTTPRRHQNRNHKPEPLSLEAPFQNEPDTDFSLRANRYWAHQIAEKWKHKQIEQIPLVINGKQVHSKAKVGKGFDPSSPDRPAYTYTLAEWEEIDQALDCAKEAEKSWARISVEERCKLLQRVAQKMREKRGDLIGVMMLDGAKTPFEADPEVSEAIDFAEYYLRSMRKMHACEDITWTPKGTVLVTPPWNFPVSIPAGGILAALAMGNCVLFKPAAEAVLSGWELVQLFWEAGIPKEVLQYVNCEDDPVGSRLIRDERIDCVILTGATATAELFKRLRPKLDLSAETGGKNAIIVSALSDRDLAIKDIVQSAFGHSGQKCSACSLLILEAEVYDDPRFLEQLKDATESIKVGSCWDPSNKMTHLIREPSEALLNGLTHLEKGESWLVKPQCDPKNPNLWTPAIKLGVKPGSFSHQTEFFGPLLSVIRAKDFEEAIAIANGTPYGLTSGLESLDTQEILTWMEEIEAGNCYINRGITGAIVRRQAFGGTKASSFGHGAKAGGPNYLAQFATPKQVALPQEKKSVSDKVNGLTHLIEKLSLSEKELGLWYASVSNYAFWAEYFAKDHDPSLVVGQDNLLRFRPHKQVAFRIQEKDSLFDILRVLAAAMSCHASIDISISRQSPHLQHLKQRFDCKEESEQAFCQRVKAKAYRRVRLISKPSDALIEAAAHTLCFLDYAPVLANGRFELLHFLREINFSIDYHRYGNLGARELQKRHLIL